MKSYWDVIIASWKLYPIPRQDDLKYSQPWQFLLVSQETLWLWNVTLKRMNLFCSCQIHSCTLVGWRCFCNETLSHNSGLWSYTCCPEMVVLAAFSKRSVFHAKDISESESNLEFDPSNDTWSTIKHWKCWLYKEVGYPNFQQLSQIPLNKLNFCFLKTFLGKGLIHQIW